MALKINLRALFGFGIVLAVGSCGPRLATTSADVGAGEGGVLAVADRADDTAPTYHADVAAILQKNCVTCHREAQATDFDDGNGFYASDLVAPMGLRTYEDARSSRCDACCRYSTASCSSPTRPPTSTSSPGGRSTPGGPS